ncbi:MAG: hypothetical protein JXX14_04825 [Deltaproteobacteria bacterium]|nr:hypothetical protein [Deltaproteobacteria bacterium]
MYKKIPVALLWGLFVLSVTFSGMAGAIPKNDTLHTDREGACIITAPRRNSGVIDSLSQVCTVDAVRVFRQLGAVDKHGAFEPLQIRVVGHPSEMHELAPSGSSLPLWSGAVAFPIQNLIMLPLQRLDGGAAGDLDVTVLHEMSHVAFNRASGGGKTPRWFSEGVAILQSEGSPYRRNSSIWWASLIDDIKPLSQIEQYPQGARAAEQAYAQAADFTAFLIERGGWTGIREVLLELRRGRTFDAAFQQTYGVSTRYLEKRWRAQLFGGMGWLMHVTGDGMWLGLGALICIAGYFLVQRRKKRRLKEMGEEEAQLDSTIAALDTAMDSSAGSASDTPSDTVFNRDTMTTKQPSLGPAPVVSARVSLSPVMDRLKARRTQSQIELDGKFHTLH